MKKRYKYGVTLLTLLTLSACQSQNSTTTQTQTTAIQTELNNKTADLDTVFGTYSEEDFVTTYDEKTATQINFGSSTKIIGEGASEEENSVTITKSGTYILSGESKNSQLKIAVDSDETVRLILNNVTLSNDFGAALYVESGNKVIITLAEGSANTLSDSSKSTNETETAVIFSKASLSFNGDGQLVINGNYKNGIVSKDTLSILSGTYQVKSVKNGITGKDYLQVYSGVIDVATESGDGLKSNNSKNEEKGMVFIDGGTLTIQSGRDGIDAERTLKIQNSKIDILTADGTKTKELIENESYKALKAGELLFVQSGEITIDSADDGFHSNKDVEIIDGTIQIAAKDDGVHADEQLTLSGGTIQVTESYEGLEATIINLAGAKVSVVASDDGINASDGSSAEGAMNAPGIANEAILLNITDGEIFVDAMGDGIDSNGNVTMSGGTLIVNGTNQNGNSAIDYDGTFKLTGGTLVAVGSSQMAQSVSDGSTQSVINLSFDQIQNKGTTLGVTTGDDEFILGLTSIREFQYAVISSPNLIKEASYKVSVGGKITGEVNNGFYDSGTIDMKEAQVTSVQLSDTINSFNQSGEIINQPSGGMGGGPGQGGGSGGRPNQELGEEPEHPGFNGEGNPPEESNGKTE